jgi:hypothetical protein
MQYFPVERIKITLQGLNGPCIVQMSDALVHIETESDLLKNIIDSKSVGHGVFRHQTLRGASIECDITHHKDGIGLLRSYGMLHRSGRARDRHGVVRAIAGCQASSAQLASQELGLHPLSPQTSGVTQDRPRFAYGVLTCATSLIYMLNDNGEHIAFPMGPISPAGTIVIKNTKKRFGSLTKLASILGPCRTKFHDTIKVLTKGSPRSAKIEIAYDPGAKDKGKITLTFMRGSIPGKSHSVSVAHFVGVIKRNASLSEESNKRILEEWWDRGKCPHKDYCPRNCANYIKAGCGPGENPRWPTPDHVKCKCQAQVSRFHYDIEIARNEPKPLDGVMSDLAHMYDEHPRMFRYSKLGILLGHDRNLLESISEYVFGPYDDPREKKIPGPQAEASPAEE